ncbi:hypothetical protein DaAHT2_1846 [Desulfurivibrio alkaliphilus AHT 2]|uniref:Uncharacterized protein n=1 Tax=Desulfurivibrio alkaliphilus (strain DSM 19089 / UNIQEM U267 / AHT2) TaxID=589865 RepID=D6Z4Q2_DESAT|nr:hypothetical protein [Desulfurivibrio alkaliphilus]ADH86527.1 hypothetical protein DaAHT2_1846 [Desulfurivibrio alkaliphilus AHT 2]
MRECNRKNSDPTRTQWQFQWQFGARQSLAQINRDHLQHHPDRAKPALPAAAGHLQYGTTAEAHRFVRLARDWGCGEELISRKSWKFCGGNFPPQN